MPNRFQINLSRFQLLVLAGLAAILLALLWGRFGRETETRQLPYDPDARAGEDYFPPEEQYNPDPIVEEIYPDGREYQRGGPDYIDERAGLGLGPDYVGPNSYDRIAGRDPAFDRLEEYDPYAEDDGPGNDPYGTGSRNGSGDRSGLGDDPYRNSDGSRTGGPYGERSSDGADDLPSGRYTYDENGRRITLPSSNQNYRDRGNMNTRRDGDGRLVQYPYEEERRGGSGVAMPGGGYYDSCQPVDAYGNRPCKRALRYYIVNEVRNEHRLIDYPYPQHLSIYAIRPFERGVARTFGYERGMFPTYCIDLEGRQMPCENRLP